MSHLSSDASGPSARRLTAHAICVYAEPLASDRRVVVIGDASLDVGAVLLDAGARMVHLYDPVAERALRHAGQTRGVTVRPLAAEFDVRDGAFDLAIVLDIASIGDPPGLLARLRRLVGVTGSVLVGAENPDAAEPGHRTIDYPDLFDLVSMQFEHVSMIGQVPFVGVTLAELGATDEEPEVSVDTRLGPEEKMPQAFWALAGQSAVALAPYALVELQPVESRKDDGAMDALRAELAKAKLNGELLANQLDEARVASQRAVAESEASSSRRVRELEEHVNAVEARAGEHFVRAERMAQEVAALEAEALRLRARAVELEEQAGDYKKMRAHSEVELAAARASIADLEERLAQLSRELEARVAQPPVPAVDPEAVARLAARAEEADRAGEVIAQLEADLESVGELHGEELAQLETILRDRAQTIGSLEREVARRERLVRELVSALDEVRAHGEETHGPISAPVSAPPPVIDPNPELVRENRALRDKLDQLAVEAARHKGDLHAQEWRVSELEQKLEALSSASVSSASVQAAKLASSDESGDLLRIRAELDALRQALAQEHEARRQLESGEALAKAHAELSRQATLIEQLSRELDARDRRQPSPEPG